MGGYGSTLSYGLVGTIMSSVLIVKLGLRPRPTQYRPYRYEPLRAFLAERQLAWYSLIVLTR